MILGKLRFMHSSQGSYITIVHNNELSPKIFLEKINSIITNTRIVKMLKDLHILQNKMENLVKEITQSVEEIPSLIQNKEYRTSAQCCPGMFALMFNYLK